MSYIVRKIGGGSFNPRTICVSNDSSHLFIALGCQISVFHIPELEEVDTITTHKSHVTSIVCHEKNLISADRDGYIYWHKLNGFSIVDKNPVKMFQCAYPIEKLLLRDNKLFYIYFAKRLFWCLEFENENNSIFRVNTETQKVLISSLHPGLILQGLQPVRFNTLDGFDINDEATTAVIVDKCKLHIYNFAEKKDTVYPNPFPIMMTKFRNNQIITFLTNGMLFIYDTEKRTPIRDHWHYACPNAFTFTDKCVISGGFEGVLTFFNEERHCHEHVARLGITIEGVQVTPNNRYIVAQYDKNMLGVLEASAASHAVISSLSNITGDVHFCSGKLVSIRRPNHVQVFDCSTSKPITQLQVSSFNSNTPLTDCAVGRDYMITVETAGGKGAPKLTIGAQVHMNHKKPHANTAAHDFAYEKLLLKDRYAAMKAIKRIKYGKRDEEEAAVDDQAIEREGNPLVKDPDAANIVDYSEIKIWRPDEHTPSKFRLMQSFRCIGKTAHPVALHPTLSVFAIVISHELQVWRLAENDMWEMWQSAHVPIIPQNIIWSNDGTILVAQYPKRIDLIDAESLSVAATHQLESLVSTVRFISDCEIAIQTNLGIHIFDIRSLSETKVVFAQAACSDAADKAFVFVLNKAQPVVVLYDDGKMVSWQVPAHAPIKCVHVTREGERCTITALDEDNFLWGINEFGIEDKIKERPLTISAPKPREARKMQRKEIRSDHVSEISDLLKVPSHLVYKQIEEAFFDIVLVRRASKGVSVIPVTIEDIEKEEEVENAVNYSAAEIAEMRQLFA